MPQQALPSLSSGDPSQWDQALYAFLVEKGNRSGSQRTVQSYSHMLWPFFAGRTPDRVKPAEVLAYAHGIGVSGRAPSSATIGARIACLSSYFRFCIRMSLVTANPCARTGGAPVTTAVRSPRFGLRGPDAIDCARLSAAQGVDVDARCAGCGWRSLGIHSGWRSRRGQVRRRRLLARPAARPSSGRARRCGAPTGQGRIRSP
jgi:hypothetical protein